MAKALILFAGLFLPLAVCQAQIGRDPTQPPGAFVTPSGDVGQSGGDEAVTEAHVLQSIVRRHGGKPKAVINGQLLGLGGKIDDWVLVRIGESDALLKGPGGTEKLVMSPDVGKQPTSAAIVRRQR